MTFKGEFLKSKRKLKGMTAMELARRVGVDRSQVSRWENGNQQPYPAQVKKIAKILGVKPEDLFKLNNEERTPNVSQEPETASR